MQRTTWATLRTLFPEGTDRRPFLQHVDESVIQLNQPKLPRQSKRKRRASSSLPFSPTWRAGMLLSLSPFGPRLIHSSHHPCSALHEPLDGTASASTTIINRLPTREANHLEVCLYRVRCLAAHWPLTWPPSGLNALAAPKKRCNKNHWITTTTHLQTRLPDCKPNCRPKCRPS